MDLVSCDLITLFRRQLTLCRISLYLQGGGGGGIGCMQCNVKFSGVLGGLILSVCV